MAASFWESSHRRTWLFERGALERAYAQMEDGLAPQERHRLKVYFTEQIQKLGRHAKVRQRVIATANVLFRRFYTKNLLCDYDPFLVAPTCLYLASKAEECTVQAKIWTRMQNKYDVAAMLEMEMFLIEELEYSLVVFHPYRPLMQILADAELQELTKYSWSLVNDSYHTDICLLYPPHMCALACVYTAAVLMGKELRPWLESLNIDLDEVTNITRELLAYYESYKQGDPKQMNELIRKTTDFRAASQQQQGEHSAAAAQRAPPLPPQQ